MIKKVEIRFKWSLGLWRGYRRVLVEVKAKPKIRSMTVEVDLLRPDGRRFHRALTWPSWRGGFLKKPGGRWPNLGQIKVGRRGGDWLILYRIYDKGKLVLEGERVKTIR